MLGNMDWGLSNRAWEALEKRKKKMLCKKSFELMPHMRRQFALKAVAGLYFQSNPIFSIFIHVLILVFVPGVLSVVSNKQMSC